MYVRMPKFDAKFTDVIRFDVFKLAVAESA